MSMSPATDPRDVLKKAYVEIRSLRARLAESEEARAEPIAIVGLGCRFPGGANDAESFWSVLRDGVDAVGLVPPERWDSDAFFDPDPDAPGTLYTRHGAFVDNVDRFDAELFGISPVEASSIDPQQRLLLEVAWEALENAGIAPESLRATRTGVFVGLMYQDYLARQLREHGNSGIGPYLGTGSTFSAAAGRLSYVLGLQGPSMAVDTACSSSLVAVHLACQALRNRECDVALAGGANVMLTPEASINLSKARMLSPTGRCRTFDAEADGYIRGEGSGLIVLKRLSQARADGDRILGLVRGSAVNQDGRSNGLTAPNGSAQRALLREALEAARISADEVEYVECHGTGTPLGDPIEVGALLDVYGRRSHETPFAIGSVKTNFGHLESAAGICGLIKALLVLRHREIPPHLHLTTVNPRISIDGKPVVIPTAPTKWFKQTKPMAAVSAFGFVGTNAHVILEAFDADAHPAAVHERDAHVLTLSAATEAALDEVRERFARYLATTDDDLGDICFTANTGRSHLPYRIAVVASDCESMQRKLREAKPQRAPEESPRVAFLWTGDGEQQALLEQWRAWGVEPSIVVAPGETSLQGDELLVDLDAFSTMLDALAALHVQGVRIDWRAFHAPSAPRKVALPTYAFQRERYWIKPATKPAAAPSPAPATLLGTRLPQAPHQPDTFVWQVDVDRKRRAYLFEHKLLGTEVWPISAQMQLALEAARDALGVERCRISALDFNQTLYSSDTQSVQVVLTRSGDATADLRIYSRAAASAEWTLNTTARIEPHAASATRKTLALSMMFFAATDEDDAADRYRLIVESARFADRNGFRSVWVPERHFTNMGSLYPSPAVLHAALARETKHVRLMAGSVVLPLHNVARIAEEWAMVDNLSGGRVGISLASGWNPDDFVLAAGRYDARYDDLYKGVDTLRGLWRGETFEAETPHGKRVALRTYPTPVQADLPLWITAARSPESFRRAGALGANLLTHLLDQDVETLAGKIALYRAARAEHGFDPDEGVVTVMCHTFVAADEDTAQRLAKKPFCDYLKSSLPLLAGLAYSRGQDIDVHKLSPAELDQFVEFLYERFRTTRALIGTPEGCRPLLDALDAAGVNEVACLLDFGPATDEVLAHLPQLASMQQKAIASGEEHVRIDAARHANCTRDFPLEQFYASLSAAGVDFDGSLRGLAALAIGDGEALAQIAPSGEHAVLLDACIQTALGTLPRGANEPLRVPTHVRSVRMHRPLAGTLHAHARHGARRSDGNVDADVTVFNSDGDVLLEIEGLHVKTISRPARAEDEWFYEIAWSASAWPEPRRVSSRPWLILDDRGGVGRAFASARAGAAHVLVQHGAVTEQLAPGRWTVDPRDGFSRLLRQLDLGVYEGILCLWPLDAAPNEGLDVATLEADQSLGVEAIPALVQALAERGHVPPLWLVTRGAQPVTPDAAPLHVSQSTLWGLAGAVAREHREWWGGIIDLDSDAPVQRAAEELGRALECDGDDDQVAVRGGVRYVRRLVRSSAPPHDLSFRDDAAYLIAGGAGGLGLAVARWMIERGARHLILVGRSPRVELPHLGAEVTYVALDIADEERLAAFLAERDGPPVRGVMHTAGIFRDAALLQLDRDNLRDVLRAKVSGAWSLHRATRGLDLDFFILFSSFSAITPPHGQASYAAASAFLDAVAHARRAEGKAALSINWGAWSDIGFAATDVGREAHARLESMGMRRMTPGEGLAALARLMGRGIPAQMAVFPMDVRTIGALDPALEHAPLLRELVVPESTQVHGQSAGVLLHAMRQMDAEAQRELLREEVARMVSAVMEIPRVRLDVTVPLTQLGLDSLIAVQLKNLLEKETGLSVPLVNTLRGASVASMVDDLLVDLRLGALRAEVQAVEAGAQQELEL